MKNELTSKMNLKDLNIATLIVLLFTAITLLSCDHHKTNKYLEEYKLKGEVKYVKQFAYLITYSGEKKVTDKGFSFQNSELNFDSDGYLTDRTVYDFNNLFYQQFFTYDSKGRLIEEQYIGGRLVNNSKSTTRIKYTNGSIIKESYKNNKLYMIVEIERSKNESISNTYQVDENGAKSLDYKSKTVYDSRGRVIESVSNRSNIKYSYDNRGNIKSKIVHMHSNDQTDTYLYEYNDHNDISRVKKMSFNALVNTETIYIFEYEYDKYDNWTKYNQFDERKDGTTNLSQVAEREIIYY